jgi:valyl-tRNA synthetase
LVRTDGVPAIGETGGKRPRGTVLSVAGEVEVLVGLKGLVDPGKEGERIARNLKKVDKDVAVLDKRLNNPKFIDKAPPEVVTEAKEQKAALLRQRARLEEALALLDELE